MDKAKALAAVFTHPNFDREPVKNDTRRSRPAGAVSLAARRRQLDRPDQERSSTTPLQGNAITISLLANGDIDYRFGGRFRESRRETAAALARVLLAALED